MWHWIKEDGARSSQVRPVHKGKIWTVNKDDCDDDMEERRIVNIKNAQFTSNINTK